MRTPQFSITNNRNIRFVACEQLPRIMIITGPNDCGKSTLLDALRQSSGPAGLIPKSASVYQAAKQVCVLMDEPDLHLHPNL